LEVEECRTPLVNESFPPPPNEEPGEIVGESGTLIRP